MARKNNKVAAMDQETGLAVLEKLDRIEQHIIESNRIAIRNSAIAGGVSGGIVAISIGFIKSKLGL